MEFIKQWIKGIAFYMIFSTLIVGLLPKESYKKYVRFFLGIWLVLLVVSPITKLLKLDITFENYANLYGLLQMNPIEKETYKNAEREATSYVIDLYKQNIEEEIIHMVESYKLVVDTIEIELEKDINNENYGKILSISLVLNKVEETENIFVAPVVLSKEGVANKDKNYGLEEDMKEEICNSYDVLYENIYVQVND